MDKIKKIKIDISIYTAVSFIVVTGLIYFILIPQGQKIEIAKQGINDQLIKMERNYKEGQSLKKITTNLKTVEAKLPELEDIYIKKEEAYLFASALEDIASHNNISQKLNIAPYSNNQSSQYHQGEIQATLTGTYNNLINYLADLEALPQYVNLRSMEINNSTPSIADVPNPDKNISMKITANIYWSNK